MTQIEYRLKLGQDEFTIKMDCKDEKEFFESASFFSNLPKHGPNGEEDIKITFRTTPEGHKYYSLVSEKAQQEFRFGQNKENSGGGLFPKGWAPLFKKDDNQQSSGNGLAPIGMPQQAPTPVAAPLIGQFPGLVNPITGPSASVGLAPSYAPTPQPVQAPPQPVAAPVQTQAPTVSPQVTQQANDVLARFNIKR